MPPSTILARSLSQAPSIVTLSRGCLVSDHREPPDSSPSLASLFPARFRPPPASVLVAATAIELPFPSFAAVCRGSCWQFIPAHRRRWGVCSGPIGWSGRHGRGPTRPNYPNRHGSLGSTCFRTVWTPLSTFIEWVEVYFLKPNNSGHVYHLLHILWYVYTFLTGW